jgi:hypothetical protein
MYSISGNTISLFLFFVSCSDEKSRNFNPVFIVCMPVLSSTDGGGHETTILEGGNWKLVRTEIQFLGLWFF